MKKFSNITGQKIIEKPQIEQKIDEREILKLKMLSLMEQFLSIETFGPIDRYQRFGLIKIKGKEILIEAILSLMDNNSIESHTKLLESLKSEVKDWKAIDKKINDLNNNSQDFKLNYKLNKIIEKYKDDEDFLFSFLSEKINKIDNKNKLFSYLRAINNNSKISENLKSKINITFNAKP